MKLYELKKGDVIEIDGIKAVFFKCDGGYAQLFEYGKKMKPETMGFVSCNFDGFKLLKEKVEL
jgi:hypothetical protein